MGRRIEKKNTRVKTRDGLVIEPSDPAKESRTTVAVIAHIFIQAKDA